LSQRLSHACFPYKEKAVLRLLNLRKAPYTCVNLPGMCSWSSSLGGLIGTILLQAPQKASRTNVARLNGYPMVILRSIREPCPEGVSVLALAFIDGLLTISFGNLGGSPSGVQFDLAVSYPSWWGQTCFVIGHQASTPALDP